MVRNSYYNSVVAININGFYCGRLLHHGSVNDRELYLAIYFQGKMFQGGHVSTKIFYLELYYQ